MDYWGISTFEEKEKDGRIDLIASPTVTRTMEEILNTTKAIKNTTVRNGNKTAFKSELKIFNFASYSVETNDRLSATILSIGELISKPVFIVHLPLIVALITYFTLKGGK